MNCIQPFLFQEKGFIEALIIICITCLFTLLGIGVGFFKYSIDFITGVLKTLTTVVDFLIFCAFAYIIVMTLLQGSTTMTDHLLRSDDFIFKTDFIP